MIENYQKMRILNYFPEYMEKDSIFQKMVEMGAPWAEDIALDMDIAYFTMYSGTKTPTVFVKINSVDSIANSATIARILWNLFGTNWKHLWNAYTIEYNPTDNYNVTDTTQRNTTDNRTINRTDSSTDTGTVTDKLLHGQTVTVDDDVNQFNYGFNSTEEVPVHHVADDTTTTYSGTDTDTTERNLVSAGTQDTKDNDTVDDHIERTRAGNIGQTSYQDLLRQDFELWKWNFYQQVFEDVDRFLALSVFCPVD